MSNWKRTKDELPEDNQYVAFSSDGLYSHIGWFDKKENIFITDELWETIFDAENIVGWCPVPEYDL